MDPDEKAASIIKKYRAQADADKEERLEKTEARERDKKTAIEGFADALRLLKEIAKAFDSAHYSSYKLTFGEAHASIGNRNRPLISGRGRKQRQHTAESYHYFTYSYDIDIEKLKCTEQVKSGLSSQGTIVGALAYAFLGEPKEKVSVTYFETLEGLLGDYEQKLEFIKNRLR